ncbi:MAG TPA: hypothetical protein VFU97_15805 [Xanthobacteraceae bacterium]|nr:hypothetical protein [Xanthobacteraceae bacterium]
MWAMSRHRPHVLGAWRSTDPAAEVYAALWLGALLAATGAPIDPFPPALADLARRYFELYSPEGKV